MVSPHRGGVADLAGQEARLLVRAEDDGDAHPTYTAAIVAAQARIDAGTPRPLDGRLRLLLPAGTVVRAGDRWLVAGRVEPAPVDGGYGDWLRQNGIAGSMVVRLAQLERRPPAPPWARAWRWLQARIDRGLAHALPPREAAFAETLLLGGRHTLPAELQADLSTTGTSHLATASAFNLMLLYGLVVAGCAPLLGRRWAILLGFALALGYGAAVGLRPPVLRGMLVLAWLALAALSGRPWSRVVALIDALALLLLPQPSLLRDVAFQLTFAAACGIAVLAPLLARALASPGGEEESSGAAGAMIGAAITSIAASLASLPFIAVQFGTFSPLAMPTNALVTPLVPTTTALALIVGLAASAASWLTPLAAPLWLLLILCERIVHTFAALPIANPSAPAAGVAWSAAAAATVGGTAWLARRRAAPRRNPGVARRPLLVPLCCAAAAGLVLAGVGPLRADSGAPAGASITVLPVKGATALLLSSADGNHLLLSDGDAPAALAFALESALPPGSTLTAAIPLDMRTGTLAALRVIAGDAVLCPGMSGSGGCAPSGAAQGQAGRMEVALGGADRLRLSSDGAHPPVALLSTSSGTIVLAGQPAQADLPDGVDLVLLPAWSRDSSHLWLQRLAPRAIALLGAWPVEAQRTLAALLPSARLVTTEPGERLRIAGTNAHGPDRLR